MTIERQSTVQAAEDEPLPSNASYLRGIARDRSLRDPSRYRQMLDALPAAIYTTDPDGRVTYFNPAAVLLTGRTPELGADRWCVSWKLYYANGTPMPHDQCPMAVALKEGRAVHGETAILERPDGTRVWFMPYPTPWLDAQGRVIGGINMLVDVSDRIRDDARIRSSEARLASEASALRKLNELASRLWRAPTLRAGLDEMLAAILELLGADFGNVQLLDLTDRVLRIEAQIGFEQPFLDFFREVTLHDDAACGRALRLGQRVLIEDVDADEAFAPMREIARQAGFRAVQSTPLIGRDGLALGMMSTHWRRPHLPDEQTLGRLDLYVRQAIDFIERKRVEEALRRSEQRFRDFASATSSEIYCMSADWSQMRKLRGRDFVADSVAQDRSWVETHVHPEDSPRVQASILDAVESRSSLELEHRVKPIDGTTPWTQLRAIPLIGEDGRVIEWIAAASDITQRKSNEEGLRLREIVMAGQREALEMAINDAPLEVSLGVLVRTAIHGVGDDARAGFYLANADKTALQHVVGMSPEYALAVDGFTVGPDSLACGLATHTGKPVLTSDVREDQLWQPWLWMAEKFDYRACWSFPILSTQKSFIGTLAVYSRRPREATARDVDFCSLITHTASLIISRHAEMQARKQIERALRISEERHRQTLSLMPAAVYSCDATGVITYFNRKLPTCGDVHPNSATRTSASAAPTR